LRGSVALSNFEPVPVTRKLLRFGLSLAACVLLAGCLPSAQGPLDEQREPHFLTAKARAASLDYSGAIEAYEAALEANPRNGSAHYELGLLCEKEGDYAAAIYHLQRYLKLRPDAPNAQVIQDRISADKMELSKTAAFAPVTQNLEREFQKLAEEKQTLKAELERTQAELNQWRAQANSRPNTPPTTTTRPPDPNSGGATRPPSLEPRTTSAHKVQAGETFTSIASRHRISVTQLQAANPGVDSRRLKVGQTLTIPSSGR
jgi:LysM repeat protein